MNPIEHPEMILLIHGETIRREMNRGARERIGRGDIPRPVGRRQPSRLRAAISRGLIALARRIEPNDPATSGTPATARH